MKTKVLVLISLAALLMLLPVVSAVNAQSVNMQTHWADGAVTPPPPFPPQTQLADGAVTPPPPFPPQTQLADGAVTPPPPFPPMSAGTVG
jgi:hypothetical protein